jgi:hypothetical protein
MKRFGFLKSNLEIELKMVNEKGPAEASPLKLARDYFQPLFLNDVQAFNHVRLRFKPKAGWVNPLNLVQHLEPFDNLAENGMLAIQEWCRRECNEDLAAVRARTGICHAQDPFAGVPQAGVKFVLETVAGTATARAGRIAGLRHEILEHPVEDDAIEVMVSRQPDETIDRDGCLIGIQLRDHAAFAGFDHGGIRLALFGRFASAGELRDALFGQVRGEAVTGWNKIAHGFPFNGLICWILEVRLFRIRLLRIRLLRIGLIRFYFFSARCTRASCGLVWLAVRHAPLYQGRSNLR